MIDKKKRRHSSSEDSSSSSSSSSSDSDSTSGSSSDDSRVKKEKSEKSAPKTSEGRDKSKSAERFSISYDKIDSEDFSPLKKVSKFENPTSSARPRQSGNIRRRSSSHEKSPGRKMEKGRSRVSVSESIKESLSTERKKERVRSGGVRNSPPRKTRSRSGSRQRATYARQGNSEDTRRNDTLWSSRIRKSSRSRSREHSPRRRSSRSPRGRHSRSVTPRKSRSRSRGRNIRRRSSTRSRSSSREARQRRQQQRPNWNQGRRPPLRPPFRFRSRSPRPRPNSNYLRRSRSRSQSRTSRGGGGRGQTPRKTSPSKDQRSLRRKSRSQSNPPRRLPLVNSREVKSPRRPSGALTSDKTKKDISGTSDSESSSSSSSRSQTPVKKKKEKKRKAKEKKKKKKLLKKAKKLAKKKRKVKSKAAKAEKSPVAAAAVIPIGPSPPKKQKTAPDQALIEKAKKYAPKSQAEWEKEQSVVRKVLDEETGRVRLVKGTGEIIESIVSRQQHKDINKSATRQDGESFQQHLKSQLK